VRQVPLSSQPGAARTDFCAQSVIINELTKMLEIHSNNSKAGLGLVALSVVLERT
jgi:hypothetical protein